MDYGYRETGACTSSLENDEAVDAAYLVRARAKRWCTWPRPAATATSARAAGSG